MINYMDQSPWGFHNWEHREGEAFIQYSVCRQSTPLRVKPSPNDYNLRSLLLICQ